MDVTREQRIYARVAGVCFLANYVLQGLGDSVTLMRSGSETFVETARWAAVSAVLYRFALLEVAAAWIVIGVLAFALYAVLEPVNRRLALPAGRLHGDRNAVGSLRCEAVSGSANANG